MSRNIAEHRALYRKLLITGRLLKPDDALGYSAEVATTRWGDAINRLLADRGWTQRQLADAAGIRPNTLTNLLKHGRPSDTGTLARIASALKVDISELFLTKEQSVVLHAHREDRIGHLRELVVKELSDTVTRIVAQQLEGAGYLSESDPNSAKAEKYQIRRGRRKKTTRSVR